MLVTLGRMPTEIVAALGGVDQGGGVYDVSLPVAMMVRAVGGAESVDAHPGSNLLLESGDNILLENGTDAFLLE